MKRRLPESLTELANACPSPLYLVGGSVRDFLRGALKEQPDWDITSATDEDAVLAAARTLGFTVKAVYRNTGTVKMSDRTGVSYEFTRYRSDKYVRGRHVPSEITFTGDIAVDARRRDFCANAVYYDIAKGEFCDPLGGIQDIKRKILRTVAPAEKVFGEDGLRLMRLARFVAQTGFAPDEECLAGATRNASLIRDIAPERIFTELSLILNAERGEDAYRGLCVLRQTGVLKEILPELALGDGMAQKKEFHDHDVLEHSLRCVKYAPCEIRLAALLHDVGKPLCFLRDGNFYEHEKEGAVLAEEILTRLKAPKKLVEDTRDLVLLHMRDFNGLMRENKVRKTLVERYPLIPRLLLLFQADFSACKDDLSPAPVAVKWRSILQKMKEEHAPLTLKELAIGGKDAQAAGVSPSRTGQVLEELLLYAAFDGSHNTRKHLIDRVKKFYVDTKEKP